MPTGLGSRPTFSCSHSRTGDPPEPVDPPSQPGREAACSIQVASCLSTSLSDSRTSRERTSLPPVLPLAHGEPGNAAVGIRHHPAADRQRPRDNELSPLGG